MSKSDRPPEVYKVIGAPGTGKTTRVVGNPALPDVESLVIENLRDYPIEDQLIVTYTNAGVDEAADRLKKILNAPKTTIDQRVVTIHAHCYRTLGVNKDEVVRWWHKQDFCKRNDLKYGMDNDDGDIMSAEQDEGHALFDIYGWLKSNMKPLEEYIDCPADYPCTDDPLELMERWEEYKANPPEKDSWKNNPDKLIDFSDMIERVVYWGQELLHDSGIPKIFGDNPDDPMETFKKARHQDRFNQERWRGRGPFTDTRVLYVDEVQDLTPLQWSWYLMQKLVAEKVYIGGDDDQTIYGWAGANPNFMLDEEGDFEVLEKTYRIPSNIWEVCDGVIRQVDKRQEKKVEPHGEGGDVVIMRAPPPSRVMEHIEGRESMVLFRARYMIDEFRESLHHHGIPYRNMSTFNTWNDDVTIIRDALAKIEKDSENLTSEELDTLIDYAVRECTQCRGDGCQECEWEGEVSMLAEENDYDSKAAALGKLGGGHSPDRVDRIFDLSTHYMDYSFSADRFLSQTSELNYYEKKAIKGNLRAGNEDLQPDTLRIGTIHSAKGKEAPVIILATDSTQRILQEMLDELKDDPEKRINDAERRVYYVGMTRASEKLVLCQGIIDTENCINLSDLLEEYEPPDDEWAVRDTTYKSGWSD